MFSKQFVAVALCTLSALAVPSPLVPVKRANNGIPGRYIVTFKDGVGRFSGAFITSIISPQSKVTHEWDILNAFAGNLTDGDLELLRSNPNVASIEQDGYVYTQAIVTQ